MTFFARRAQSIGLFFLVLIPVLSPLFLEAPRGKAHRNTVKMMAALDRAYPEVARENPSRIESVVLPGLVTLVPEKEQTVMGHRIKLHVRAALFEIEAEPVVLGKTGMQSLFRDLHGKLHADVGRPASAESPIR